MGRERSHKRKERKIIAHANPGRKAETSGNMYQRKHQDNARDKQLSPNLQIDETITENNTRP